MAAAVQERAAMANEAAARAQENAIQAQERAVATQERASRSAEVAEAAALAQERATAAQERAAALQQRATTTNEAAARTQEAAAQIQQRSATVQERVSRIGAAAEILQERASQAQDRSAVLQERTSRASETAAILLERASQTQERSSAIHDRASTVSDAAARIQERAVQARDRTGALEARVSTVSQIAAQIQERGSAAQQRAATIEERASWAADAAANVQARAEEVQDRASAAEDRAARLSDAAALADERAKEAQVRAAALNLADASSEADEQDAESGDGRGERTPAQRFADLVRSHSDVLELVDGFAAVRSEVIAIDPTRAALEAARRSGYAVTAEETFEQLKARYVTLAVPSGKPIETALLELRGLASGTEFSANHIHLQSGTIAEASKRAPLAPSVAIKGPAIGIIDGGVAKTGILPKIAQRGFAAGGLSPSTHGTAVASLAAGTSRIRSGSPGAPLLVADVYGRDPKGGNALTLARALNWMAERKVPVIVLSLVGPPNPIVAKAIKTVQARGTIVVAAVGNAGPAAPPMYPAAYSDVIGVTAVDPKNRALLEAGRGAHVAFAAPGADILAFNSLGQLIKVRGTSFAAPLVAGKLWSARASANPRSVLENQAIDLGKPGRDPVFGQGLLCGDCR
jgi:hypothetical protein